MDIILQSVDRIYLDMKTMMYRSFISGIFFALGTTIGLSIVLAVISYSLLRLKEIQPLKQIINETHIDSVLPKK